MKTFKQLFFIFLTSIILAGCGAQNSPASQGISPENTHVLHAVDFTKKKQSTTSNTQPLDTTNEAIEKGINFLYESQLEYGEFKTYACKDEKMTNCFLDSSPFITTFVLYSIKKIENDKVKSMTDKSISFLSSEEEPGGVWRYWTSRNSKEISPDLDDISTISFTLRSNQIAFDNNVNTIEQNKDASGRFYTWFEKNTNENDIDCAANANALLYLGDNYPKVCEYINDSIKSNERCSIYYPDELSLFYLVSRAFVNNIPCLDENKKLIIDKILAKRKKDDSFGNDLQTALAINTLLNYEYTGPEIKDAIHFLNNTQEDDGSWSKSLFFLGPAPYYGSEELSTAIALEALNGYKLQIQNKLRL